MFRGIRNLLHGRIEYRTECLPVSRIGEVIEGLVNGESSFLKIEGEDERDFDAKIDFIRELNKNQDYHVKSIWRDSFSGRKDKRVYFDIYAHDRRAGRDIYITGNYVTLENKARNSPTLSQRRA